MARVFLSLGSNLGDRRRHLDEALRQLAACEAIRVVTCSHLYEREPWPGEPIERDRWYLSCAVEIETQLAPRRLLQLLQLIEAGAGRERHALPPGTPDQALDIDILLYGDEVVSDYDLQIPHLLLHERRFVLAPLAEIAPEVEHPVLYRSIRDLLAETPDPGQVFLYPA